jgi:hypothetical protein
MGSGEWRVESDVAPLAGSHLKLLARYLPTTL